MTSVFNGATKQNVNDIGYYINVGDMRTRIQAYNATAGAVTFSTASWGWSTSNGAAGSLFSSNLATAGGAIFKDMGKTVVSSNRTFRKVQLVVNNPLGLSTGGVSGKVGTSPVEDYYTAYIELGFDGTGTPAPVAHFGR